MGEGNYNREECHVAHEEEGKRGRGDERCEAEG